MPDQGLLLLLTDIPSENEEEFNRWYNEKHIPDLQAFPGVLSARRYRIVEGKPKYMAMYDLEKDEILESHEYQKAANLSSSEKFPKSFMNTIRGVYHLLQALPSPEPTDLSAARVLLLRGLSVEPEHERELEEWYEVEHLPNLFGVPGMIRARRYKLSTEASNLRGNPPLYMAVYEMDSLEVLESERFHQAVETPWTDRVRPYFRAPEFRNVYRRILPA
jgi:hypothetical protein